MAGRLANWRRSLLGGSVWIENWREKDHLKQMASNQQMTVSLGSVNNGGASLRAIPLPDGGTQIEFKEWDEHNHVVRTETFIRRGHNVMVAESAPLMLGDDGAVV